METDNEVDSKLLLIKPSATSSFKTLQAVSKCISPNIQCMHSTLLTHFLEARLLLSLPRLTNAKRCGG